MNDIILKKKIRKTPPQSYQDPTSTPVNISASSRLSFQPHEGEGISVGRRIERRPVIPSNSGMYYSNNYLPANIQSNQHQYPFVAENDMNENRNNYAGECLKEECYKSPQLPHQVPLQPPPQVLHHNQPQVQPQVQPPQCQVQVEESLDESYIHEREFEDEEGEFEEYDEEERKSCSVL